MSHRHDLPNPRFGPPLHRHSGSKLPEIVGGEGRVRVSRIVVTRRWDVRVGIENHRGVGIGNRLSIQHPAFKGRRDGGVHRRAAVVLYEPTVSGGISRTSTTSCGSIPAPATNDAHLRAAR